MANLLSTRDPIFLDRVKSYFNTNSEVLILVRYSRHAGAKDFRFLSSFTAFESLLVPLRASTSLTVFKNPDLPYRGIVDDAFIAQCLISIAEGAEFFILDMGNNDHTTGETHEELRDALEDFRGRRVALGPYPPFWKDTPEIITAYVPEKNGLLTPGAY